MTEQDKSTWGPGPWQDEPDRLEWRHASGLACLIVRAHTGSLCGYVGCPEGHPWFGKDYGAPELGAIEAHGGLTYADACQGDICHEPMPGEGEVWWLGFDCAHYMDRSPAMEARLRALGTDLLSSFGHYRTIAYVRAEVERLAEQVAAAGRA